jgi:hypothetical protein
MTMARFIGPRQISMLNMLDALAPVVAQPAAEWPPAVRHGDEKFLVEIYSDLIEDERKNATWRYVFSDRRPGIKHLHEGSLHS